jgi:hypothetical protein
MKVNGCFVIEVYYAKRTESLRLRVAEAGFAVEEAIAIGRVVAVLGLEMKCIDVGCLSPF